MVKVVNVAEIETISKVVENKDKKKKRNKDKNNVPIKIISAKKRFWLAFVNRFRKYCSVTAIHGWGHVVRVDFTKWEK